mgnify:FL=1
MERHDVVSEVVLDTVTVPKSRVGDVDPANDAVDLARRADTAYDRRVSSVSYEANSKHDHWLVLVKGIMSGSGTSKAKAMPEGDFIEGPYPMRHRAVDVANELARTMTVSELRDMRGRTGASFERGSTKAEMAKQLVEQAPREAFEAAAP